MKVYKTISMVFLLLMGLLCFEGSFAGNDNAFTKNKVIAMYSPTILKAISDATEEKITNEEGLEVLETMDPVAFKVFFKSAQYNQSQETNKLLLTITRNQEKIIALLSKAKKKRG